MLYQLADGRTVEISLSEYLTCSDEEIEALKATYYGIEINNPQYGSAITKFQRIEKDEEDDYSSLDIYDVPEEEKLDNMDYDEDDI